MRTQRSDVGAGWVLFAGIVMIVGGFFAFFEGLGALLRSGRFYTAVANYPYGASIRTWGWIELIGGALVLLAGFYVMRGAVWARIVGITLATLSAFANFFFIPFYPFWALLVIALDIFVIWGAGGAWQSAGGRHDLSGIAWASGQQIGRRRLGALVSCSGSLIDRGFSCGTWPPTKNSARRICGRISDAAMTVRRHDQPIGRKE